MTEIPRDMRGMDQQRRDRARAVRKVASLVEQTLRDDRDFVTWLHCLAGEMKLGVNPLELFLKDLTGFTWDVGPVVMRPLRLREAWVATPEWVRCFLEAIGTCHVGIEPLTVADCLAVFSEQREEFSHGEESVE
jgi:hypothetical protein